MILIHHNPACSTSRQVLEAIRAAGVEPEVIDYRRTGWQREQLTQLLRDAGLTPREALRTRGAQAEQAAALARADDEAILNAMLADPLLVERPFVTTSAGTRLCRPKERLAEILPAARFPA